MHCCFVTHLQVFITKYMHMHKNFNLASMYRCIWHIIMWILHNYTSNGNTCTGTGSITIGGTVTVYFGRVSLVQYIGLKTKSFTNHIFTTYMW